MVEAEIGKILGEKFYTLGMKWSRREDYPYVECGFLETSGSDVRSLFDDIVEQEKGNKGQLESLKEEVSFLKDIVAKLVEEMNAEDIERIIRGVTYGDDYTIKGDD